MPDSHILKIAEIIDYAAFYTAAPNNPVTKAGRKVALGKAREIAAYLEKEGLLG